MESGTNEQKLMKKFKPKYELSALQPKPPIKYASVIITRASQPREIYIQIQDRDTPRFSEMLSDLQEEFRSSTVYSSSYCPSPVVGNAYVLKTKTDQWWRVLIEMKEGETVVFFVDSGHRLHVQPGMMFHEIPDRYLEFPAQAVRCHLHSVYTRMNSFDQSILPPSMYGFVDKYEYTPAVAFFNGWSGTDVGTVGTNSLEFSADTILYRNGDSNSVNVQVCLTSMAYVISPNVESPEHHQIRERLSAIKTAGHSVIPPTMVVAFPPSSAAIEDKQIAICWVGEEKIIIPVRFFGLESPDSIFFRTLGLMKESSDLQNTIDIYFGSQKDSSGDPINVDVGYLCAVKSMNKWRRAEVVNVEEYPEIGLTLLDKGFYTKVNVSNIRRLPAELNQAPRTILRCTLADVYPLSAGNEWGDHVTHFIKNRIQTAAKITIGWQKYPDFSSGKALPVTVYVHGKESNGALDTRPNLVCLNLNEELVSLGLASKSYIIGTASKTASKLVWKSLELPKVGESFTASVTWFNEKGEIFLRDSRSKEEVDYIRQTLDEKYRNSLPTKADLSCAPGDLCIAKYKDEWFRCTIREIRGNGVKIYFADCGIVGIVDIKDIRMDIILEDVPVQILRCSLWNLKPSGGAKKWSSDERKSILNEGLQSTEFLVNVKNAGSPIQVELAYKSELEFVSFNKKMVEKGLAVFVSN